MSIANCVIGPLYDEQIKKTLMYADHKFKRLMNTRMSLLEHLSPHYDLSSMFSYELEGRVFQIKLIKPEIKLSRQQLIFSSLFLEQDFLKEYKKHISNTLQKTIKQCIKKYKQKIKIKPSILDYISRVTHTDQIMPLMKYWIPDVEVIQPASIRQQFAEDIQSALKRYTQPSNVP